MDKWLVGGFEGLMNVLEQRANSKEPMTQEHIDKIDKIRRNLGIICVVLRRKEVGEPLPKDLKQMDDWYWRGLNGLVNLLSSRPKGAMRKGLMTRDLERLTSMIEEIEL